MLQTKTMKYSNKIANLFLVFLTAISSVFSQIEKPELVPQIGHVQQIQYAEFSPDNKILAVFSEESLTIKLWETASGRLLREFTSNNIVHSLKFTPDGKKLAVIYNLGMGAELLNVTSGKILKAFEGSEDNLFLEFSPTGKILLSTSSKDDSTSIIDIWNVETKTKSGTLAGDFDEAVAFSPDEKILAVSEKNGIGFWNIASRKKIRQFSEATDERITLAFSPDGKYFVRRGYDSIKFCDSLSGKILKTFTDEAMPIISFENKTYVIAKIGEKVKIFEVGNGESLDGILTSISKRSDYYPFTLSSDGKILASINEYGRTIKLWDVKSGLETITLPEKLFHYSVAISPDEKTLAIGNYEGTINLWDVSSGTNPRVISAHNYFVEQIAFSNDGKTLASASDDATIKLWDLQSGENLQTENRQSASYQEIPRLFPGFPEEKKNTSDRFTVGSSDGLVKIFDKKSGKELANLIVFNEKDWLVTTPEGLFDGTPNTWKQLIWRFNNDTFNYAPVEAFFNEFYYPGLLQEIFAGKKPKPPAKNLASIDIRQPHITFSEISGQTVNSESALATDKRKVTVKLEITDNNDKGRRAGLPLSSGANDLRLFRNGSLIKRLEKDVFALSEEDGCLQIPATAKSPRKTACHIDVPIVAGENIFTAYAFNHDNVKSNDATAEIKGADSLKRQGMMYVLAIGVNKYANTVFNLKYAVSDVEAVGKEISLQQSKLSDKQYAETRVITLTDTQATKANIVAALKKFSGAAGSSDNPVLAKIKQIEPEDALIIYFAGHGLANKDRFYLIPHDGIPTSFTGSVNADAAEQKRLLTQGQSVMNQSGLEQLFKQSISDIELEELLETVNAGKLMMVIDACNSGQALEAEEKRRGPMNSRGLAQLAYEKGMNILTASQSFQAALEATTLNHGLLTYALLEGMAKGDKDSDKSIIDREWLDYGVTNVPLLQIKARGKRQLTQSKETTPTTKEIKESELQTPRVFYRREQDGKPLVIALP